jgi:oligopeptide/dipeptide ABC transporter ATP-binding protein
MAGSGTAHMRDAGEVLLRVDSLVMEFPVGRTGEKVHAVSDVSIDVRPGETLGLVGESGCGKSTTGKSIMQMPRPTSGTVRFEDIELTERGGEDMRRVRPRMQMIFQDPISSLNPRRTVRDIVAEPLRIWASEQHPPGPPVAGASTLLRLDSAWRFGLFGVLVIMWLFNGLFPYLANSGFELLPDVWEQLTGAGGGIVINAVLFGSMAYGLSISVRDRVPRSRSVLGIYAAANVLLGVLAVLSDGAALGRAVWWIGALLAIVELVLVLTPKATDDYALMVGVREDHEQLVRETLERVGLDPEYALDRRPHEFSGGQCQRICIARTLVLDPNLIICDEPVSALDVSVQAQILNLLQDMKARYDLTLVFIAHDLAVVKNVSDRVAVMYLGKLCEVAEPEDLYNRPAHPYTAALLASIPVPDPTRRPREENILGGEIPSPVSPPTGCRFRTRCPKAQDMCAQVEPKMRQVGLGHYVACHFPVDT